MQTENVSKEQKGNDANRVLAITDKLIKELDFLLSNCGFQKKNEWDSSFNINDIRPKLNKLRDEYVQLRKGCC
jgi:hypothetical protein